MKKLLSLTLALVMTLGFTAVPAATGTGVEVNLRMNGFPEGGFIRIEGETVTNTLSVPAVAAGQTVEINAGYWHGILFSGISIVEKGTNNVLYRSGDQGRVRNNANNGDLPAYAALRLRPGHFGFVEGDGKPALPLTWQWRHNQNEPTAVHAKFVMPADITVDVDIIAHWTPHFGDTNGNGFYELSDGVDTALLSVGGTPLSPMVILFNADTNGNGFLEISDGVDTALFAVGGVPINAFGAQWHNRAGGNSGWFNYHNTLGLHLRPN